jgi:CHAT domain-containing protein
LAAANRSTFLFPPPSYFRFDINEKSIIEELELIKEPVSDFQKTERNGHITENNGIHKFNHNSKMQKDADIFNRLCNRLPDILSCEDRGKTDFIRMFESLEETFEKNKTVVACTISAEEILFIVIVTSEIRRVYESCISRNGLKILANNFRNVVNNRKIDPRPLGLKLFNYIIKPIKHELDDACKNANNIMFYLDSVLRCIPMSALWDGTHWFSEMYASSLFTPSTIDKLRINPQKKDVKGVAFGLSKQILDFNPLNSVPQELEAIIKTKNSELGIIKGEIFLNEDFNLNTVLDNLIQKPDVVHFSTHFQLDTSDHLNSCIFLGDGSHLTIKEIKEDIRFKFKGIDLITLSGCYTASGSLIKNSSRFDSFGEILLSRGVASVIASLWQAEDVSSKILMEYFYRQCYKNNFNKAEALRLAQNEVMKNRCYCLEQSSDNVDDEELIFEDDDEIDKVIDFPDWEESGFSHPYFWACYILMGNWK